MKLLIFILSLLFQSGADASIMHQNYEGEVQKVLSLQQDLLERVRTHHGKREWELARLDVELAMAASGQLGLVGVGGQGAVELIWERKQLDQEERESSIVTSRNPQEIFRALKDRVLEELASDRMTRRQKRRIFQLLRKDAAEVGKMITALQTMPRVGDWYVDGFFKTYYLSKSFGISEVAEIGYDKRVRFRFIFAGPLQRQDHTELSLKQKAHKHVMRMLQGLSDLETPDRAFELSRVWLRSDVTLEKDFIVFSSGVGRGFQTVYRRVPAAQRVGVVEAFGAVPMKEAVDKLAHFPFALMRSLGAVQQRSTSFPLSQMRFKFEWSVDTGFWLLGAEKAQVLDLHYFRKETL